MSWRWLLRMLVFIYFTVLLALLGIRYLLLPNIDQFKPWIADQLSQAIGTEVKMQAVQAGWQGFHISLQVAGLQLLDEDGQPLLEVPQARGVVSWRSLLQGEPVFASLTAEDLTLKTHRDASGHLWLLGHRFSRQSWIRQLPDPLPQGAQWLLAQQQVLVQNASVLWRDDSQQGVSSRLDAITIQLENTARRHRLGLVANVAGSKAGKIEGSGYIKRQTPFGPPDRGAIQLTLPELPAKQWRSWIELPSELLFSTASMKAWLTLEHGRLNHLTTRLAAQEVSLTLVENTVVTTQQAYADIQLPFAHLRLPMRGFKTAAEHGVQATVSAQQMQVLVPQAYDHALQFEQVSAVGNAVYEQEQWQLVIPALSLYNQDAEAHVQGRWQQTSDPWGWLTLQARLAQANAARIVHYLPKAVPASVRQWLDEALPAGEVQGARIEVEGPLQDFPFDHPLASGKFQVRAPYQQLTLDYHPHPMDGSAHGWPKLTQLRGEFAMDNGDINIHADDGVFALEQDKTIQVRDVKATLADVRHDVTVKIQGQTDGLAAGYEQFYRESPLHELFNHGLDDFTMQGEWKLPLQLAIPLADDESARVKGELHLHDSQLQWGTRLPPLKSLSGQLSFTESGLEIKQATAHWWDDEVQLSGAVGPDTNNSIALHGHAQLAALQSWLELPGLARLQGRLPYDLTIANLLSGDASNGPTFDMQSSLQGSKLQFPEPLGKAAQEAMPLHVSWGPGEQAQEQQLRVQLGDTVQANFYHDAGQAANTPFFQRGQIEAGLTVDPVSDGLVVGISHPVFDAGAWDAIIDEFTPSETAPSRSWLPPLLRLQLQADQARLLGTDLTQVHLALQRDGPLDWQADLDAKEAVGRLQWMEVEGKINGPLQADFKRIALGDDNKPEQAKSSEKASALPDDIDVPELNLTVDELILSGRRLGQLELHGVSEQAGRVWRLSELALSSPSADLLGSGRWVLSGEHRGLVLDATADVRDLGAYLDQIGFPDLLAGGEGTVAADIQWLDLPWKFDLSQIVGNVQFEFQEGRLSTVNSETARLLELISMQSISRLARLDINPLELTKSGFPFDVIRGSLDLDQGRLQTQDYHVAGPAGTMVVDGNITLGSAALDLDAVVVPNLDVSGAAIAAGVVVNPVVGLGAFITQWLLKDPLADAMAARYKIRGTLQDPDIQAETRSKAPPSEEPEPITP